MRFHRWRSILLAMAPGIGVGSLAAQTSISPYAAVGLGAADLRNRITISVGSTQRHSSVNSANLLATATAGLSLSPHVAIDAVLRTTLGLKPLQPFRAVTVGPLLRVPSNPMVVVRAGLGRIRGSDTFICLDSPSGCMGYIHEWRKGFDVSAGVELPLRTGLSIAPSIWWIQTVGGDTQYRSLGVGLQIRFH